jgi:D-alanyl-D-alanine carboxypeptidase
VARPAPGSAEPIRPVMVKTLSVRKAKIRTASVAPVEVASPPPPAPSRAVSARAAYAADAPETPAGGRPAVLGVMPARTVIATPAELPPAAPAATAPAGERTAPAPVAAAPAETTHSTSPAPAAPKIAARSGWVIQVGAFVVEADAKQRLTAVQGKLRALASADPFTESVIKGDKTYYRARFAGFDKDQAEAACRQLKRNDIACMALRI